MWFEVGFCPFTPVWPTGARRSRWAGGADPSRSVLDATGVPVLPRILANRLYHCGWLTTAIRLPVPLPGGLGESTEGSADRMDRRDLPPRLRHVAGVRLGWPRRAHRGERSGLPGGRGLGRRLRRAGHQVNLGPAAHGVDGNGSWVGQLVRRRRDLGDLRVGPRRRGAVPVAGRPGLPVVLRLHTHRAGDVADRQRGRHARPVVPRRAATGGIALRTGVGLGSGRRRSGGWSRSVLVRAVVVLPAGRLGVVHHGGAHAGAGRAGPTAHDQPAGYRHRGSCNRRQRVSVPGAPMALT